MTGQRKNEILPEISQAEEWFDLDRSEKMPDFSEFHPDDGDRWFPDEHEIQLVCPTCGSDDFIYAGEAYDDDQYLGSSYDCQECGRNFTMMDSFEDGE